MPEYSDTVGVPAPFETALTWVLAAATVLDYDLRGKVSDTGLQLLADVWRLNDNAVLLDLVLTDRGDGTTSIAVHGRNRPGKLFVSVGTIQKRVAKLVDVLAGYGKAFSEGGEVPTMSPPTRPPEP